MFGSILRGIIGTLIGKTIDKSAGALATNAGSLIGKTVANGATLAATLAALYPLWVWFNDGGSEKVFATISLTYGEAVFIALIVAVVVKVSQYTPAPTSHRWNSEFRAERAGKVIDMDGN